MVLPAASSLSLSSSADIAAEINQLLLRKSKKIKASNRRSTSKRGSNDDKGDDATATKSLTADSMVSAATRLDALRQLFTRLIQAGEFVVPPIDDTRGGSCNPNNNNNSNSNSYINKTATKTETETNALQQWQDFLQTAFDAMIDQLCQCITLTTTTTTTTKSSAVASSAIASHGHGAPVIAPQRWAIRTLWGVVVAASKQSLVFNSNNNNSNNNKNYGANQDLLHQALLCRWICAVCDYPITWTRVTATAAATATNTSTAATTTTTTTATTCTSSFDQGARHMIAQEFIAPYQDVQISVLEAVDLVATKWYHSYCSSPDRNNTSNKMATTTASTLDSLRCNPNASEVSSECWEQRAARLVELLMMIPVVMSRSEWASRNATNLLPSSASTTTRKISRQQPCIDDDDHDSDSQDLNDDDESSSSSSSDDDSNKKALKSRHRRRRRDRRPNVAATATATAWDRYRHALAQAWISVLRLPSLPLTSLKQRVLPHLPLAVLPIVPHPLQFADFFLQAYHQGPLLLLPSSSALQRKRNKTMAESSKQLRPQSTKRHEELDVADASSNSIVSMLALQGLFQLMTQHGLEYPDYYKQLYRLLTRAAPWMQHANSNSNSNSSNNNNNNSGWNLLRASLLRNTMLPAHVVAAFVKRLLRACLATTAAPPSFILSALTLVEELLRSHAELLCLIHRGSSNNICMNDNSNSNDMVNSMVLLRDAFDAETDDPTQARALESSAWELDALPHHYIPAIAALARSIGRSVSKQATATANAAAAVITGTTSDVNVTYSTLMEQERKRRRTRPVVPTAAAASSSSGTAAHSSKKFKRSNLMGTNNPDRHSNITPLAFVSPTTLFPSHDIMAGLIQIQQQPTS